MVTNRGVNFFINNMTAHSLKEDESYAKKYFL